MACVGYSIDLFLVSRMKCMEIDLKETGLLMRIGMAAHETKSCPQFHFEFAIALRHKEFEEWIPERDSLKFYFCLL